MDFRHDLLAIVQAGIRAAAGDVLLARAFQSYGVPDGPLSVISAGKASRSMAAIASARLGSRIHHGLLVSNRPTAALERFESMVGGHPAPTFESEQAGRRALAIAESTTRDESLILLLSGGASALMAVPAEGVSLDDKRRTTDWLLRAGADIGALNAVRKHLSAIKGGRLAARTVGRCFTYAVSDVVGDDVSVIGSGPTVADATTFGEALDVLRRFGGLDEYPRAVVTLLERGAAGAAEETTKPGDPRIARAQTRVIGSRKDAMAGSAAEARRLGYHVQTIHDPVVGEAREAAVRHFNQLARLAGSAARPLCLVSSGETTVKVRGRGRGGRNQEFALALAERISALEAPVLLASVGTDGIDGPTDAAGAIVDQTTVSRARSARLDPQKFLNDNNAYAFFAALGDLIHTGPTDTNVGDLQVVLLA